MLYRHTVHEIPGSVRLDDLARYEGFTISICSDDLGKRLTAAMNLPVHDPRGDPLGKMAKAECLQVWPLL